jgi:hypothetical protein
VIYFSRPQEGLEWTIEPILRDGQLGVTLQYTLALLEGWRALARLPRNKRTGFAVWHDSAKAAATRLVPIRATNNTVI